MIQFNLLPDVKIDYIKAVRKQQIVTFVAFIIAVCCLAVFLLVFTIVKYQQPRHISDLDKDIKSNVGKLQSNKDLDKVLTIQNQLKSLPGLHENKTINSRIFGYLSQVVPSKATLSAVDISVVDKKMSLKGSADSTITFNKFVDTLKFTEFKDDTDTEKPVTGKAFPTVVVSSFNIDSSSGSASGGVSFSLDVTYDSVIFKNTAKDGNAVANTISLKVPSIVTTRSSTQQPSTDLFKQTETKKEGTSDL